MFDSVLGCIFPVFILNCLKPLNIYASSLSDQSPSKRWGYTPHGRDGAVSNLAESIGERMSAFAAIAVPRLAQSAMGQSRMTGS